MVRRQRRVRIKDIFRGLQNQMEAKLTFNRRSIDHSTTKGTATELEWTEMLATYLPKRYCAERAFVVDAAGRISEQIDIVVFDRQYSPFILKQNGVAYIPAESVYAVIEVKQDLTPANISYAQKKAASVRRLKRTSVAIPHAGGEYSPKKPARIIAGIVTLDGILSPTSKRRLENATDSSLLSLGCSLRGKVRFDLPNLHPFKKSVRPQQVVSRDDDNSLVDFVMTLARELQRVGTVAAIDIDAYLK